MRGLRTPKSAIWLMLCAVAAMLAVVACGAAEPEVVRVVETVVVTEQVVKEVEVVKEVVREVEVVKEVPKEVIKQVEVVKEVPVEREVIKQVVVVATPGPADQGQFLMQTLDPFPKRGGTLRLGAHGPPAHFDVAASVTIANHGSQSSMYDTLLRHDPRTPSVPIVPDLAHRWEISSDGQTYRFSLREGVKFHDGDELTSADVKATYDRIIFPREGLVSLRQVFFQAVDSVDTPDAYTVEFTLKEPRASDTMLAAFASEWNHIVKKSTLDENDGNLRQVDDHPGTGPFIYQARDDDKWVVEKNVDYWNPNAPYVDRLEHIWLVAWTPENTAALLGGQTDWTMWLAPKDGRNIGDNPGLSQGRMHSFTAGMINLNTERAGLDDPRVRRAMMLAVDTPILVETVKDIIGIEWGEFFVAGTPYALSPLEAAQIPGLRSPTEEDLAEAKRLMAEAGYPNGEGFPKLDLLTRETPDQRTSMPALQAMLIERLGIQGEIRLSDVSQYIEDTVEGNYDVALGASKSLAGDPSDYIRNAYGVCGEQLCDNNFSRWRNEDFNQLIRDFELELDLDKRIAITDEIRTLLLAEAPAIPHINSEIVYWGWSDDVKGMMPDNSDFFTWYELHKWDNVWLDR